MSEYGWTVVDEKGFKAGEQVLVLAYFVSEAAASEFIATLPECETGRYGLDAPGWWVD